MLLLTDEDKKLSNRRGTAQMWEVTWSWTYRHRN